MRASTRSACALIAIVVLGLATQAKGQDIADAENRAAVDEHPCSKDLHTEACSDSCTMQDTCNRHGRCRGNTGLCECFAGWSGAGCDIADPCVQDVYAQGCTAECSMEDTCNNHGRCLGDGSCACFPGFSGTNCNTGGGGDDPCGKDM
ncbi:hypothetical protein T484DRAFT_1830995 [Baffinella frigidus]|nr:hypothetical protein T484DRAFT_1830995 [Cryptophyta sp. CCMP2293]